MHAYSYQKQKQYSEVLTSLCHVAKRGGIENMEKAVFLAAHCHNCWGENLRDFGYYQDNHERGNVFCLLNSFSVSLIQFKQSAVVSKYACLRKSLCAHVKPVCAYKFYVLVQKSYMSTYSSIKNNDHFLCNE